MSKSLISQDGVCPLAKKERTVSLFMVTLTGVDDTADLDEISALSKQYPFVEWAVLFLSKKAGIERYPSLECRHEIVKILSGGNLAAHLCGADVKAFAEGHDDLLYELQSYGRIQLNFNARWLATSIQEALVKRVEELTRERPTLRVITQHNRSNIEVRRQYEHIPGTQALFDASGGRGIVASDWEASLPNTVCGYAGGLGPDNVEDEIRKISLKAGSHPFWIDMENKLRTDGKFDLVKCHPVLASVAAWQAQQ